MDKVQKLIMLPGPTNVSERVMKAMLGPIINHRGDEFRELYGGVLEKTRHLFQTKGDVVIFSSSGTGGVEAAVWNLIRPGDVALVPVFGEFSSRLAETVEMAGGTSIRVKSDSGKVPSFDELKAAAEKAGKFKVLFLVHNETSTGVAAPYVREATRLASDHGAFSVIDAISSLGGYSIPRGETPFTPALPLMYALDEAMKELLEEGLAKRVARHDRMSAMLYEGLAGIGLSPVADREVRSKTVVASYYPPGVEDANFRRTLSKDKGIVIAGGFGPFAGKVFRVGCMGQVNEEFVSRTLDAIGETLSIQKSA
ncbi:MAG: alanine--glyoxylate aminotransferase family protein [Thaumarchaeota archaeon]|nr:alanine--glyoxylate aminotransferase family protein [Nitrososphaerota archaeon]